MAQTSPAEIHAIASHGESGWWQTVQAETPGQRVNFDYVNGVPEQRAVNAPICVIDTTASGERGDVGGLFLVVAGCLVDVELFAAQLEGKRAAHQSADDLTMGDFIRAGSAVPLTKTSSYSLPPQSVGGRLTLSQGGMVGDVQRGGRPCNRIRSMEVDLRPYGVKSPREAAEWAAKHALNATGVTTEGGVTTSKAVLDGRTPMARVAKRLNYALVPEKTQERARRPVNRHEVFDVARGYLAKRLVDGAPYN